MAQSTKKDFLDEAQKDLKAVLWSNLTPFLHHPSRTALMLFSALPRAETIIFLPLTGPFVPSYGYLQRNNVTDTWTVLSPIGPLYSSSLLNPFFWSEVSPPPRRTTPPSSALWKDVRRMPSSAQPFQPYRCTAPSSSPRLSSLTSRMSLCGTAWHLRHSSLKVTTTQTRIRTITTTAWCLRLSSLKVTTAHTQSWLWSYHKSNKRGD